MSLQTEHTDSVDHIKCDLCYEQEDAQNFETFPCNHSYCRCCVNKYFVHQMKLPLLTQPFTCPYCRSDIPLDVVSNSLSQQNQSLFEEWKRNKSLRVKIERAPLVYLNNLKSYFWLKLHTRPCPRCKAPTMPEEHNRRFIACASCGQHWCWMCGNVYHGRTVCPVGIKERMRQCAFAVTIVMAIITLVYHCVCFLNLFGFVNYLIYFSQSVFDQSLVWTSSLFRLLFRFPKQFMPEICITTLKYLYTVLVQMCLKGAGALLFNALFDICCVVANWNTWVLSQVLSVLLSLVLILLDVLVWGAAGLFWLLKICFHGLYNLVN